MIKIMTDKEKILHYLEYKGISKNKFYQKTGLSVGFLDSGSSLGVDKLKLIIDNYHDLNLEWFFDDNSPMLHQDTDDSIRKYKGIPLIPVEAMAGYANGDVQVMGYELEDFYNIPDFENKGVKFLIRASGSSMYPKYSNGDILACRPVTDLSFFQWGKVYVLDTDQGPLVKRLFACSDDDNCLECRSENKENYPPFRIKKSSIRKVSIVVGVVRME